MEDLEVRNDPRISPYCSEITRVLDSNLAEVTHFFRNRSGPVMGFSNLVTKAKIRRTGIFGLRVGRSIEN